MNKFNKLKNIIVFFYIILINCEIINYTHTLKIICKNYFLLYYYITKNKNTKKNKYWNKIYYILYFFVTFK